VIAAGRPSVSLLVGRDSPIRDILRELASRTPDFGLRPAARQGDTLPRLARAQHVGTAVDYLVRIVVEHLNPGLVEVNKSRRWIAERGAAKAGDSRIVPEPLVEHMRAFLVDARGRADRAAQSGQLDNEVLSDALHLSYLDSVFRVGPQRAFRQGVPTVGEYQRLVTPTAGELAELERIVNTMWSADWLVAQKRCLLNPTLGNAVVNADADLVVDDMLIDIKTTQHLTVKREHFDALLCYLVLHRSRFPDRPVEKLAIYFTRQAALAWIPVRQAIDGRKLVRLRNALTDPLWFSVNAEIFQKQLEDVGEEEQ
jgi:hypothetical protein